MLCLTPRAQSEASELLLFTVGDCSTRLVLMPVEWKGSMGNKFSRLAALRNLYFAFHFTNLEHCFEDPLTLII